MPNFTTLSRSVGDQRNDRPGVEMITRYLRDAGLVGRSAKNSKAPQIETIHVTNVVLAVMGANVQAQAAETVRELWSLHAAVVMGDPNSKHGAFEPFQDSLSFGERFVAYLEMAASEDADQRKKFASSFTNVIIWRQQAIAGFQFSDGRTETYYGKRTSKPVISVSASIPNYAIRELAELVMESRAEATRRGLTIPVADAYAALGGSIPERYCSPASSATTMPDAEATAFLPQKAATVSDQSAEAEMDGPSQAHPTDDRAPSQSPSYSPSGRSLKLMRSDDEEQSRLVTAY